MFPLSIVSYFFALLALCGMGYYALGLWSARAFKRRETWSAGEFTPPVSILKPLRGTDPEMYECLRSHCTLEYPEYEIIFGVSHADDPVIPLVRRLQGEFPSRRIELIHCSEILGTNIKVSNLVQMLPHARHDFLVVNDSDMRVAPDYLARVMAPFAGAQAKVGMVTCLYRGVAERTLGSKLEALGVSTEFMPGVLTARQLEGGVHFALGATMAMRREALEATGGFAPLLELLDDDYQLGFRIAGAGYKVEVADTVVETHLPAYRFRDFFEHQLRWARSTRNSRPAGHAGYVLTFGLPWAALAAVFAGGAAWSLALLAAAAILRVAVALSVGMGVLRDRQVLRDLWLLPLRDVIGVAVWAGSYLGNTVVWRGERFRLERGNRLRKISF